VQYLKNVNQFVGQLHFVGIYNVKNHCEIFSTFLQEVHRLVNQQKITTYFIPSLLQISHNGIMQTIFIFSVYTEKFMVSSSIISVLSLKKIVVSLWRMVLLHIKHNFCTVPCKSCCLPAGHSCMTQCQVEQDFSDMSQVSLQEAIKSTYLYCRRCWSAIPVHAHIVCTT
jgi:hypothetical protein